MNEMDVFIANEMTWVRQSNTITYVRANVCYMWADTDILTKSVLLDFLEFRR